jgi:hypothetical protein
MIKNIGLALLGVLLLSSAWLNPNLAWFSLVAFAPLLLAENNLNHPSKNTENLQWLLLSGVFSFSWFGISSYAQNSFSLLSWFSFGSGLTLALMLFKFTKDTLGNQRGYISLAFFWISAEALHYYYNLGASPITIGSVFENNVLVGPWLPQLGQFGLGLWVLISGLIFYFVLTNFLSKRQWRNLVLQGGLALALLVVAPLVVGSLPDENPSRTTTSPVGPTPAESNQTYTTQNPSLTPTQRGIYLAKADNFLARLSFFIAGFQVLFSLVKAFLDKRKIV